MNASTAEIWTIGHSIRSIEDFIGLLQENGIQTLADVRRFPGSRRHPQFSQQAFSGALVKAGIEYVHLPELGGRRPTRPDSPNTAWRSAAFRGYADYMMTREFQNGFDRLLQIAKKSRTAIMCAEVLWWQCHRSLIADELKSLGHTVRHIMRPGKTELHPYTSAARIVDGKLSYAAPEVELPLL